MKDWFDYNPELANDLLKGYNYQYRNSPEYQLKDTLFSSSMTKLMDKIEERYDSSDYFISGKTLKPFLSRSRDTFLDPRLFSRKPLINPETGKEYVK